MEDHLECEMESSDAVEDLKLLIDSIKYQEGDLEFQEQALKTMASLVRTNGNYSGCIKKTT